MYSLSWPWRVFDPGSNLHTRMSFSVAGWSFSKVTSPYFNRRLLSRALNPKCRAIIYHKVRCKTVGFEFPNSSHSRLLFFVFCQLSGGTGFVPFAMFYNKLLAFGTLDFSREFKLVSINYIHVWTSFVQGTLKTSLKTRQTNRLVLRALQFLHSFEKFAQQ